MDRERPKSNASNQSDSLRLKRNSFHNNSSSNGDKKLEQFDQKKIKLPEIRRDASLTQGQIQTQAGSKSSHPPNSKNFNNSNSQNKQINDENQLNGAALYASYNTTGVGYNSSQKSRQSLDMSMQPYINPSQFQQTNIAQVQLASEVQGQQPVAIGLSYVLNKIKKDRKVTDEEALIMENRIKLLKKEEHKTKKKIEEMNKKSEEIFSIKARHEQTKYMRQIMQQEEEMRIQSAKEQHEQQRMKQKEKRFDKISEILLKNHQHYEQVKSEKEAIKAMLQEQKKKEEIENVTYVKKIKKKLNQASKKIQEQKYQDVEKIIERYQQEIQLEEQRKLENQIKIQKMEQVEQNLIKKLQKSQVIQHQALLQLQDAIKLKPSEYAAKVTTKSLEMSAGKNRFIVKRGQNTEIDINNQEQFNPYNYQVKGNSNLEQHSKSFQVNYTTNQTPNKKQGQFNSGNQTYCLDSDVQGSDLNNNVHSSNQNNSFNLSKELDNSPEGQQKVIINKEQQIQSSKEDHNFEQNPNNIEISQQNIDLKSQSKQDNQEKNDRSPSSRNNKRELLSRSANDIILQNGNSSDLQQQNQQQQQQNKQLQIVPNNKIYMNENKNRSQSTFNNDFRQNASPNKIRGLSQSNYKNFDTENYIQRFETENQGKDYSKKRKKSKKKKSKKSQSISTSQKHLLNYSQNYNQQQQMYAYQTPNFNLNSAFNFVNPCITHKKTSSVTPLKQQIILAKPPMIF
ncbi:hypothetical protein TTHERM_00703600 (macronuclear) [Tetrahymena thermophila SB210]|uniref:Uncharacterized protein n=1 Tax=Tetrahymena thermophila (strain SB210) TaxID=312017 RepID=Q22GG3_TETTS|nr:hypothetical protein TTHERM_00703600 [Tetrahymena thermophila SB210]EAR84368.2 hypothetical protein TTHERM_00703600 [Tetrahymena thermophila SB210]|eukprot:XP_001032031.2 hypothetical protein TTHERM_00703600 [Tetrahymena thermophila SB210]